MDTIVIGNEESHRSLVLATLIHNPTAGDGKPSQADLERILTDAGFQVRYQSSKKDWKKALKLPADLVVAAGGDGTVAKVLKEMSGSERPLALLPIGTANNIARTAGALGDARELVAGWREARSRPFDVGLATTSGEDHLFVEGAGGGIFAEAIAEGQEVVEQGRTLVGSETDRALALLQQLVEKAPARSWQVSVDGEDLSGDYLAVEAMNISHVGPSVPIAPKADPGDGLLDVVFVRESDREELLTYLDERLAQHEVNLPDLTVRRGREVVLSASGGQMRFDDELIEHRRRLEIRVLPGAARVINSSQ